MSTTSKTGKAILPVLIGLVMAILAAVGIVQAATSSQGDAKGTELSQYGDK